ncbi:50S ribosomal protein L11 methyltransferase [Patulibacter sp.]|uniref:50S ribosomal protein L11 methyltransferase n=1 Tax=Patulibacter sp. TaxID=1912859 RepID=UPI0027292A5F|nr:50S ribosomal protein L11 methyltransferase [Patulibacter sp.]MDO9409388.1 50S ribosomal protein L11 methyltransferase [Patulibacter sp.]
MIRLAFRVRAADAEIVLAELMDLAPTGVEETDLGDTIEYAIYGAEGELPSLPAVRALVGDALVEVVSEEVADDWADRWRAFHEPILIKDRLYVRPPWCDPHPDLSVAELIVDPGQAFGTGAHATTRLCLELLVELTDRRVAEGGAPGGGASTSGGGGEGAGTDGGGAPPLLGPVLDLGSGSGVLAAAAAQLGWGPVHGVDNEIASVAATLENAAANGVTVTADRFDLLRDGATAMPDPDGPAPLVLANLLRPLLLRVAADGFQGAPPHHLIGSGLLVHECDGVAAAFARIGLVEAERRTHGDWAALLLRRA